MTVGELLVVFWIGVVVGLGFGVMLSSLCWSAYFNLRLREIERLSSPERKPTPEPWWAVDVTGHPYEAEIRAFRASEHRVIILNNSWEQVSLDGRRMPPREFGPQCDTIPEGVWALAMDDRHVYCDDGSRHEWRRPMPGGNA